MGRIHVVSYLIDLGMEADLRTEEVRIQFFKRGEALCFLYIHSSGFSWSTQHYTQHVHGMKAPLLNC
jgi:hypothetical protein